MIKKIRGLILLCLALSVASSALVLGAGAEDVRIPLLTPGLAVIAARCEMVVSTAPGGEVIFTRDDFARAVGEAPASITITQSPDLSVGQLTMGSVIIPEGQVLSRASLDKMAFMPSNLPSSDEAEFRFTANGAPYEYVCIVRLDRESNVNSAPTLECATAAALSARVPEGGVCGGTLAASDPDGDGLVFEITSYPSHGSVILSDRTSGRYLYRPSAGYTGRDSFKYTVRDEWGNYAGEAEVRVIVSRFSSPDYADMAGSAETFARICEAEGLMSGTSYGGGSYFYPEKGMTRAEFTMTLLSAAGIEPNFDEEPPFADLEGITTTAKAYIAKAYMLGLTDGWIEDGRQIFGAEREITLAEAAHMTALLLRVGYDGAVEVSVGGANYARYEIAALKDAGLGYAFAGASPNRILCRADAAELLCGVLAVARAGGVSYER